jgi:trigger factor
MTELVTAQIGREYADISRMKLKRQVLDALDKAHTFTLPQTLVDNEFDAIFAQVQKSMQEAGKSFADEGKSEDDVKAEYRQIAQRRVRLGLVIGEIGEKAALQVTEDELKRAMIAQARRYPGQEKFVYEYYQKNPNALIELRAPIFEEKVIDHILEQAKPVDKKVSAEELLKPLDGDHDHAHLGHDHHDHDHGHDHHGHDHDHHHDHDHAHGHDHGHHHDHSHDHDHGHDHGSGKK